MRLDLLDDTARRAYSPERLIMLIARVQQLIVTATTYQRRLIAMAEQRKAARAAGDISTADSLVRAAGRVGRRHQHSRFAGTGHRVCRQATSAQPIRWYGPPGMSGRRACRAQGQATKLARPVRWAGCFAGLRGAFVCSGCRYPLALPPQRADRTAGSAGGAHRVVSHPVHDESHDDINGGLRGCAQGSCHTPTL